MKRVREGSLTAALLRAIADGQARGITRDELLTDWKSYNASSRKAAARRLGRLVSEGAVVETLSLWQSRTLPLRTSALVTLQVDHEGLRKDFETLKEDQARKVGHRSTAKSPRPLAQEQLPPLPALELLIWALLRKTSTWVTENESRVDPKPTLPLVVVLDACILHGGAFDIMLSALASEPRYLMRWVREIVALTPHVSACQTIQIAYRHSARIDRARFLADHDDYVPIVRMLAPGDVPDKSDPAAYRSRRARVNRARRLRTKT
jgi:hypothetical protein